MPKIRLSIIELLHYYSPIVASILALLLLEAFLYFSGENISALFEAPIIYVVLFLLNIVDFFIGHSNLKFEKINVYPSDDQIQVILRVLKETRNWKVTHLDEKVIKGFSWNPKTLIYPVKFEILRESQGILMASYLSPNLDMANTSTAGERKKNIDGLKIVSKLVIEGELEERIPSVVEQLLKSRELEKSEVSIEIMGKRLVAYGIILMFCLVPYLYRDSILFYPFLILPILGLIYMVVDVMTIRSKYGK